MKVLFYLVQWTWGIIQNTRIDSLFILVGRKHRVFHGAVITTWRLVVHLVQGCFIFTARPYDLKLIQHEYGHTVQSLILGPIWLFCDWLTKSYLVWMFQ